MRDNSVITQNTILAVSLRLQRQFDHVVRLVQPIKSF